MCWRTKSSCCDADQLGSTASALFHEFETGKASLNPQLLNRLNVFLMANFFDDIYAAKNADVG